MEMQMNAVTFFKKSFSYVSVSLLDFNKVMLIVLYRNWRELAPPAFWISESLLRSTGVWGGGRGSVDSICRTGADKDF